jgi:misacylated tRNA(Ala) deacylase
MTELIFRTDAYVRECEALVVDVNARGGIILERTNFYATSGGQPGDCGQLNLENGDICPIATTLYDSDKRIIHVAPEGSLLPQPGHTVTCSLNWDIRHAHMRMHTALHLLSAVLAYPVTGGQIGAERGRLDFNIPEAGLDKEQIGINLNRLIQGNHVVSDRWISDEELLANPELVKSMNVKPPMGTGKVRLVQIGDCDLQPCGGTHVANTSEIGEVTIAKIENKGGKNRRVRVAFKN